MKNYQKLLCVLVLTVIVLSNVNQQVLATVVASPQVSPALRKPVVSIPKYKSISSTQKKYVQNQVVVKYKNVKDLSVIKITDGKTVLQKISELKSNSNIEYVQPNFIYYPTAINTNDTYKNNLWGLDNVGQTITGDYGSVTGMADSDIDAPEAWGMSDASTSPVIVALIDTGVAYNHPDLVNNMWDGSACIGTDSNGQQLNGGCIHGYDYENNDKDPLPNNLSHGTHVAGVIAASKNNGKGVIGIAPKVKIMVIKSSLTTVDNVRSINFARQNGAKIINASWGHSGTTGTSYDIALYNAIKDFPGLFIAASGNEGFNSDDGVDTHRLYPAGFKISSSIGPGLSNIISVASTGQNDSLSGFSNYGQYSIDVAAPGENIYSTVAAKRILLENFNNVVEPNLPGGWTYTGDWGVGIHNSMGFLWGDYPNTPYINNVDSYATSPKYNLSGSGAATISFYVGCDTEYTNPEISGDFISLDLSPDGVNFSSIVYTNEWDIDTANGENPLDSTDGADYYFDSLDIPASYLTSNFTFRFHWHTDASNTPIQDYLGCYVTAVKLNKFGDGSSEPYDYLDGTSVSTAFVSGLAGLIEGYAPFLTTTQVKNTILTSGDTLSSLSGKTTTGKRVNAQKALASIVFPPVTPKPTITLVSPNGTAIDGKSFDAGAPIQVSWTSTAVAATSSWIRIDVTGKSSYSNYYQNSGSTTINLSTPVNYVAGTNYKVCVSYQPLGPGNPVLANDCSDGVFTINPAKPPVPIISSISTPFSPGVGVQVIGSNLNNPTATGTSQILIDGIVSYIPFSISLDGKKINFGAPNICSGTHTLQYMSSLGSSNVVSFEVVNSTPCSNSLQQAPAKPASQFNLPILSNKAVPLNMGAGRNQSANIFQAIINFFTNLFSR